MYGQQLRGLHSCSVGRSNQDLHAGISNFELLMSSEDFVFQEFEV